ncbi:tetratricopeptide repeat protein [Holophaga foetida]|uniref:tetratricopeptide repeat protein n=1 Tax=Holophaga foetida TaxID=35839 RepID=UPI000247461C|nr:tetratricopeptide repeat protein [Holophaga foetida]
MLILEQFHDKREALERVRQALEQDPRSPDALRLKILLEGLPPRAMALQLKTLVEQLESGGACGPPLLRALLALARTLEQCGKGKDAVPVYERALRSSPEDALEIRHHLARCLLDLRRLKELEELLERFHEEPSALTAWIRLLELQKSGEQSGLEQALEEARRANAHVEDFLTSRCRIPRHRHCQESGAPGSEEEALHVLDLIGEAWFSDRAALSWLMTRTSSNRAGGPSV